MESIQLLLIALIFISLAVMMFLRKLPAILALPVMAFCIPLVSGVPIRDIFQFVVGQGSTRLAEAYTIAFFGSMLSILLQKTGIAERFIKIGAELSGDKPLMIAISMLILITVLFTTLGGLGAIIMVSTVALPILASVGLGPVSITGIFLIGLSMGGIMNVGNWAVYTSVLRLNVEEVRGFALILFAVTFITACVYIIIQIFRDGIELERRSVVKLIAGITIFCSLAVVIYLQRGSETMQAAFAVLPLAGIVFQYLTGIFILFLVVVSVFRAFTSRAGLWWGALMTPVIPLLLILVFNVNFIAAFILGLLFGSLSTWQKNSYSIFLKSILEGGGVVMPAVILMIGIGMLLNGMMGPSGLSPVQYPNGWPVLTLLKPVMLAILPTTALGYVIFFSLAAPLALYRGPLNVWGMGYGLAAIFLVGGLNPGAIMGLLISVGQIQGISDPTNTQNVWLANEVRIDVQKILWNTLPYTWAIAVVGLILSALRFM
ncbi:MAG: citrate transporter [Ignavibacteriales bacterium]|nr:citrate transporter [Ignavibacteriales bacterium]